MHQFIVPLLVFTASALVFTMTPGLDSVMVLRTVASDGKQTGSGAILGIVTGLTIWGIGAVFGLTALLAASETGFFVVKCAGAAYLAWMGMCLLLKPRVSLSDSLGRVDDGCKNPFWLGFRRGLLTNILNPKVGIFVITFFPQFIPPHVNTVLFTSLQVGIQVLLSVLWYSLLVMLTVPLSRFLNRPEIVKRFDRLTGIIFIAFGAKIFLSQER